MKNELVDASIMPLISGAEHRTLKACQQAGKGGWIAPWVAYTHHTLIRWEAAAYANLSSTGTHALRG